MPAADPEKKTASSAVQESWADQMDDDVDESERQVEISGNLKVVTDVTNVEDIGKCKVVRHYRIGKRKITPSIAKRKSWAKFGLSANDPPGPNRATTIVSQEEIKMEFLLSKEEEEERSGMPESEQANTFGGNQQVTCRNCGMNHWTLHCPYKDKFNSMNKGAEADGKDGAGGLRKPGMGLAGKGRGLDMTGGPGGRPKDENNTIRITNLPEETQDSDIRDLFKDFGRITRIFLAKDKATGNSKGFAFVSFEQRDQALTAIRGVNGHGYNNLILSVEWARPSATN